MAKVAKLDEALARLTNARSMDRAAARDAITAALADKSNVVVAKAANLVADLKLGELAEPTAAAFDRFMVKATTTDKGCLAKTAIAKSLLAIEAPSHVAQPVFVTGVRHLQPEPVWGGSADTAAELRGLCAIGLATIGYRDVLAELAELLMDREPEPRLAAARAIAHAGHDTGALLLRMKLLAGDSRAEVLAECMASLAQLTPAASIEFLARFLEARDEETRQSAAAAIGSTHRPEAFALLRERYEKEITLDARRPLLLGVAMLRLPQAIDWLIERIETEHQQVAVVTLEAMRLYRNDDATRARINVAVARRDEQAVREGLAKFDEG
jgi:hypothetical protein